MLTNTMKRFDFLIALYITCIMISELMGAKTFPLFTLFGFKLSASVAILVLPLVYSANDVIVEVYGQERARSIVRSGLLMVALLILFSFLAVSLPPTLRFAAKEKAYDTIFGMTIRIAASSLTAFAVAEFLDVFIFAKVREMLGKKGLWIRTNLSNFVSEFFDTVLFMTLAFYALDKPFASNFVFLSGLILPYWLLKCFMSILETPLVYLGVKWLKKEN